MNTTNGLLRVVAVATIVLSLCGKMVAAQSTSSSQSKETLQREDEIARIVGYAMTRSGAPAFLETLTDRIGGRVTGSSQSLATAELILKTLRQAGFENAHFEEYELASTWQRGLATGEVISPVRRALMIGSYGWVPGTAGAIEAPVVDFGAPDTHHVPESEQVRGAAVLVDLASNASSSAYVGARFMLARQLAQAGAVAMFIISDKPDRMLEANFDGDNESFIVVGVPTYSVLGEPSDFNALHHTIIDTYARIEPRMLNLQTAVMAVVAYSFANSERAPGHRLSPAEVKQLLESTGLEPLYEMEHGPFPARPTW